MTKLLDRAFEVARTLPEGAQDEIARLVLDAVGADGAPLSLTPEEEASFDESLAQEARGEFVSETELRAFWARAQA